MSVEGTVVIAATDEPTGENDQPEEMEGVVIQADENDLKNPSIGWPEIAYFNAFVSKKIFDYSSFNSKP